MKWRPIKTVPKDGTKILLCMAEGAGGEPMDEESFGVFCQVAAWWGDEGDGEWIVYCSMVLDPQLHFEPTHWMSLPKPPKGAS